MLYLIEFNGFKSEFDIVRYHKIFLLILYLQKQTNFVGAQIRELFPNNLF